MKKKSCMILAMVLALALLVSACSSAPAAESGSAAVDNTASENVSDSAQKSTKSTLIVASSTDPGTLNPYETSNTFVDRLKDNILESVFIMDAEGTPKPHLVSEYELDADNLGITLKLRQGVKFHDGTEMKASDVLYSLKRLTAGPLQASYDFFDLENTKIIDDYTIDVRTKYVTSQIYQGLSFTFVVSEKDLEAKGNTAGQSMIGTGPFYMDSYVTGDSVTFKAYEEYWGEKPALETIIVRFIPETSVALIELETGGVDLCLDVMGADVVEIQNDPDSDYLAVSGKPTAVNYIGFNCSKAPFDDIRMRQAVAYAIDRQAIVDAAYQGLGFVPTSMVGPAYFGFTDCEYPEYNPEKAKEILAECGYADGLTINMHMDDQPFRKATTEQIINMLAAVGITLNVEYHDFATNTDLITQGNDYNVFLRQFGGGAGEIANSLKSFASAEQGYPGGTNPTKTKGIPEAEALDVVINGIYTELDTEKRAELYGEAQKVLAEELYQFPLQANPASAIMAKNLRNVSLVGNNAVYFRYAYFE